MTKIACAIFAMLPVLAADRFPANGGDITITPIIHASVRIGYAGKLIYVDPWHEGDFSHARPADLILITGAESDHLDPDLIQKLRKPGAPVVIPAAGKEKVPDGTVLANGETRDIAGITVEAVAAYDLIPGAPFHPKGRGNGYVLALGGKRIYFAGVTECVPELQALKNLDIAFLPMNLPHGRMTPAAAADCARLLKPKVVYPYHYRNGNVEEFRNALKGESVEVRLADWYLQGKGMGRGQLKAR